MHLTLCIAESTWIHLLVASGSYCVRTYSKQTLEAKDVESLRDEYDDIICVCGAFLVM